VRHTEEQGDIDAAWFVEGPQFLDCRCRLVLVDEDARFGQRARGKEGA
jgi:hypothetical protein